MNSGGVKRTLLSASALLTTFLGSAAHAEVIKVVSVSPLTGTRATLGVEFRRGAEMALRLHTPAFNKLGHSLKLLPLDDQGNPTRAGLLSGVLQGDNHILGIVGPQNSGVVNALAAALKPSPIAMVAPSSTNDDLTQQGWNYFNRLPSPDLAQAGVAAAFLKARFRPRRVYVVSDNTTYGNGLTEVMQARLAAEGVKVVGFLGASTPEQIEDVLRRIKGLDADLVYFGGTDLAAAAVLKAMRKAGVTVPFAAGHGVFSAAFVEAAGDAAEGVVFSSPMAPLDKLPAAQAFLREYRARYRAEPNPRALAAFESMNVLLLATLNEIGGVKGKVPTRAQVMAAVRKVNLPACTGTGVCLNPSGPLSFDASGERRTSRVYMLEYGKGGVPELLSTETTTR